MFHSNIENLKLKLFGTHSLKSRNFASKLNVYFCFIPHIRCGSQECPNCGGCKELVEHVLFECASYDSQRLDFLDYLKKALPLNTFKTFLLGSIFDKTAFSLGGKAKYVGK